MHLNNLRIGVKFNRPRPSELHALFVQLERLSHPTLTYTLRFILKSILRTQRRHSTELLTLHL
jgi:hypothetical protein